MLEMKNHFDISGSIEIREVDIAGVACILIAKCIRLPSECILTNVMPFKRKHYISLPPTPFSALPHHAHFQTKKKNGKSIAFFQICWYIIVNQIHTYQILQTDLV